MESIPETEKKGRVRDESKGYVYVLLHTHHACPRQSKLCQSCLVGQDAIKIGFTCGDPQKRQHRVETSETHHKLSLVYAIAVDQPRCMEDTLHYVFRSLRIKGEWFRFDTTYLPKFPEVVTWLSAYYAAAWNPDIGNWGMSILHQHFEEYLPKMHALMPLMTGRQEVLTPITPRERGGPMGFWTFYRKLGEFFESAMPSVLAVANSQGKVNTYA